MPAFDAGLYLKFALIAVGVVWVLSKYFGGSGATAEACHILVKDRATCDELKAQLDLCAPHALQAKFGQLAKEHSSCPSGKSGGSLGKFSPGQMVPAFDAVIFGEKAGRVGEVCVVETTFGCHLILIQSRVLPPDPEGEKKNGEKKE